MHAILSLFEYVVAFSTLHFSPDKTSVLFKALKHKRGDTYEYEKMSRRAANLRVEEVYVPTVIALTPPLTFTDKEVVLWLHATGQIAPQANPEEWFKSIPEIQRVPYRNLYKTSLLFTIKG